MGCVGDALESTVSALGGLGRLEPVDDGLVGLTRAAFAAVDENPGNASLVKEARECLRLLLERAAGGDDGLQELMAELAGASLSHETPAES